MLKTIQPVNAVVAQNLEITTLKQVRHENPLATKLLSSSVIATQFFQEMIGDESREVFALVGLDVKFHPVCYSVVVTGGLTEAYVDNREIFQRLLLSNANSFMVAHNHPSGDVEPSLNDLTMTRRLAKLGRMMGINLIDHLIVSDFGTYAMSEHNQLTVDNV